MIYASLQHIVWGVLLILDESAGRATAVHSVDILQVPQLTGLGMMVAAVLGIVSLYVDRHGSSITGLILSLPQQGLLVMAAWGSGAAILRSSYADGVERPQAFICADQSPVLIVLLMHTIAMIMFHHQRGTR